MKNLSVLVNVSKDWSGESAKMFSTPVTESFPVKEWLFGVWANDVNYHCTLHMVHYVV